MTRATTAATRLDLAPAQPWWRVGMMWLVIGGPAVVVAAAIVTAVIAVRGADPVIRDAQRPRTEAAADMPAQQARNHAATPAR
jgi:hypothetical protein